MRLISSGVGTSKGPPMIRRIAIENWKSIRSLDIELGRLTVLVGPNGSGKSNFVDAIRLLRDALAHGLDRAISDRQGIDSLRHWSPGGASDVTLAAHTISPAGRGQLSFTLSSSRGHFGIVREEGCWHGSGPDAPKLHYVRDARGKIELSSSDEDRVLRAEHDDELFLANGQTDTAALRGDLLSFEAYSILPDVLRTPQPPKNELVLSASGENLTSIFKMLSRSRSHKQAREEIISSLRLAMPSLEDIRVRSLGGLMMPMFRVSETDGRHDFNVSQISDGTLRLLGLLTALYQPRGPDVLALEEPEQTMHPAVLAVLADAIRDVSERRQILVTTHSPHMVEHFRADEIRTVEIRDGETSVRPLSGDQQKAVREHLFTLGELMAMEGLHS